MNTSRRKYVKNRGLLGIGTGIVIIVLVLFCNQLVSSSRAESLEKHQKYFTSVQVEEGDTLWKLAEENMTEEYRNAQEYIDEVKKMNSITDDHITTGCYLIIPYYATEPRE